MVSNKEHLPPDMQFTEELREFLAWVGCLILMFLPIAALVMVGRDSVPTTWWSEALLATLKLLVAGFLFAVAWGTISTVISNSD
jgi:hypothetical protein